jgi:aspartate/glutamate/glutamine transport system permease protein
VELSRLFEYRYWRAFLDPEIWVFLLTGLQTTLTIAVVAIVLSLIFGTLLALARLSAFRALRWPAGLFVETIRALPVLFIIFFTFFGGARGIDLFGLHVTWADPVVAAILALTIYTSAVNAEIVRAGILSIERGQVEAARSLGLSYLQTMRHVVLPQALRRMVPPQVSQLITLIKDTSLAYVIGTHELLNKAKILYSGFETGPLQALFVAACMYFAVNYALSLVTRRLEVGPGGEVRAEIAAEAGAAPTIARA